MFRRRRTVRRLFSKILMILIILLVAFSAISILYPYDYIDLINKYSDEYDIDPLLVAAIINVESKYNKDAVSPKDARGLMQIGPTTGQWAGEELNIVNYNPNMLFIPETNIRIGTWYLSKLKAEFGNNLDLVLAAYNAGSGNVQKWRLDSAFSKDGINLDNIPFKETAEYLVKVKANYKIYDSIYDNKISNSEDFGKKYFDFMNKVRKYLLNISDSYSKEDIV
ncbi:MAG: lytic transglycosylase domain-containing protein [Tissierellaceae bacterium]|nr:lytic transglycosylase domain-containing protein [Tissierellaceae bacterium]